MLTIFYLTFLIILKMAYSLEFVSKTWAIILAILGFLGVMADAK